MSKEAKLLVLFKPQFSLFVGLLALCCLFVYILLTTNSLDLRIDPDHDAVKVSDGICSQGTTYISDADESLSNCIHPHQFEFETISRVHKTPLLTLILFVTESYHYKNDSNSIALSWVTRKNLEKLDPWIIPALFFPCAEVSRLNISTKNTLCLADGKQIYKTKIPLENDSVLLQDLFYYITNHSRYSTAFVGYVNGGFLFDVSLVETLLYISRLPGGTLQGEGLLAISRSKVTDSRDFHKQFQNLSYVKETYHRGILASTIKLPLFITTRTGFPWNSVPKLFLPNPSVTNYVTMFAVAKNITTIDATHSLRCLCQESDDTGVETMDILCGKQSPLYKQVKNMGHSNCAWYFTKRNQSGLVMLYKRKLSAKNCMSESFISPSSLDFVRC